MIRAAVAAILDRLPPPAAVGGPSLVCIEGLGGAGKSVLADAVVRTYSGRIRLVHADEFYPPQDRDWRGWSSRQGYERYVDHRLLELQLLRPLQARRAARFARYDWQRNTLHEWIEIDPEGLILVEGEYLLKQRLRRYWDVAIYVDTPRDLRKARQYSRGRNDPSWIARWMAAEDYYEQVERPADGADLVVSGC